MGEDEKREGFTLSDILDAGFARTEDGNGENLNNTKVVTEDATITPDGSAVGTTITQDEYTAGDGTIQADTSYNQQTTVQPQSDNSVMINELRAQNQQLTEQLGQLVDALKQSKEAVSEQSQVAEDAVNQAANITLPYLNFQELQYMSPDEQNAAQEKYQADMLNALRQVAREEMTPIKADYESRTKEAAISAAKDQIYNDPRFSDFREHDSEIDQFIGSMPEFSSMDAGRARLLGGLINRGLRTDPNKTMTTDELVSAVLANPDAQKALEIRKAQNIQRQSESLPRMSASSGMASAAAVPERKPSSTKEELFSAVDKLWGL